jgi:hypothetical protein
LEKFIKYLRRTFDKTFQVAQTSSKAIMIIKSCSLASIFDTSAWNALTPGVLVHDSMPENSISWESFYKREGLISRGDDAPGISIGSPSKAQIFILSIKC